MRQLRGARCNSYGQELPETRVCSNDMINHSRISSPLLVILLTAFYAAVGLALYAPGLDAPMYYDSEGLIAGNEAIFAKKSLSAVVGIFPQRPLPMVTFYLNYLAGGMDPVSFRIVNVILMALLSALVALLIRSILGIPKLRYTATQQEKTVVAALLGLLFFVHPLQVLATMYIWQRTNLLAALLSCASIATYLSVRMSRFPGKALGYGLCLLFFVCGLLSKENAIVVPAILLLCECALFKEPWKDVAVRACVLAAVVFSVLWVLSFLQHPHGHPELGTGVIATVRQYYAEAELTLPEVLLTQSRVIFSYLYTILFPAPSQVWLFKPLILSRSVLTPPTTALALAGVVGLSIAAVWLLRRRPAVGFGILFFLIGLVPEAILVPQYPYLGYRCLLPMIGLSVCAADGIMALLAAVETTRLRRAAQLGIAGLLVCLGYFEGAISHAKAVLWKDPVSFWEEHVAGIPKAGDLDRFSTSKALNNLAHSQLRYGGNPSDALAHLQRAAELSPGSWVIHHNMGTAYKRLKSYDQAVHCYRKALEINPGSAATRQSLEEVVQLVKTSRGD